jgi:sugar lactone lactonase YvrE
MLGACATTTKVSGPPKRFFWPSEPDEPRIEWLAAYSGDLDIKEKGLMSAIVGDDSTVELKRPVSVVGDGEGHFVVCDQVLAQAFMFDLNKSVVLPLGGSANMAEITRPTGVAVDAKGNFYVGDTSSRKVFVVNGENKILRIIDLSANAKSIGSIAVDRLRSTLLIPDAKGRQILVYNLTGELLKTVDGTGYFSYPNAVAVASDGSMYIADSFNATIVHFSAEGKYVSSIGKRGDSAGNLTLVTGVAVDSEDHIYVTDGRMHNVTIFDKDANTLLVIGGQHSIKSGNIARGGFSIPQGIGIDKNDRIYIADSFNSRVQVFQYLNQHYLKEHPIIKPQP